MTVFSGTVGDGDLANQAINGFSLDNAVAWRQANDGSGVAVLAAMSYVVNTTTLASLDRAMKCDGADMESLAVVPWNNSTAAGAGWLEVFGIIGTEPNPSRARITGAVQGGGTKQRVIRGASLAFTGVESFGAVEEAFDTGDDLTVAGDAVAASMIAAFFATRSGLKNMNKTQRYLQNTGTALGISEARGTGSSFDFTAERDLAGPWSAVSVVLNPASNVASVKPLVVAPAMVIEAGCLPRAAGARRITFEVEPED